jgi:alpha-beta hydrolase superfamily lysophospholipase
MLIAFFRPHIILGYIEGTYQGKKLHYRKYVPKDGKPKAVVVWQHGIHGESGYGMKRKDGRYTCFALRCRTMLEEGFAIYAMDQLGHGLR